MKYLRLILILVSLSLGSCVENFDRQGYDQKYDDFTDFNKMNERNKGWFPHIISNDAYDLRNTSYLDSLCAFGSFSYPKDSFYDSVFTNAKEKINISLFEEKLQNHFKRKPNWFLTQTDLSKNKFAAIQIDRFYIIRDKRGKKIYFILSN